MLNEIGAKDKVPAYIKRVKDGEVRLMGFGHRVYKNYDPRAMGFPVELYPVLFAIGRTSGWISQWQEMLLDPQQKIARPRQIYLGEEYRDCIPVEKAAEPTEA